MFTSLSAAKGNGKYFVTKLFLTDILIIINNISVWNLGFGRLYCSIRGVLCNRERCPLDPKLRQGSCYT